MTLDDLKKELEQADLKYHELPAVMFPADDTDGLVLSMGNEAQGHYLVFLWVSQFDCVCVRIIQTASYRGGVAPVAVTTKRDEALMRCNLTNRAPLPGRFIMDDENQVAWQAAWFGPGEIERMINVGCASLLAFVKVLKTHGVEVEPVKSVMERIDELVEEMRQKKANEQAGDSGLGSIVTPL